MFINSRESVPSLNDLSGYMAEVHGISLRKQSLDGRFHSGAVRFLERVLARVLGDTVRLPQDEGLSTHFNRVLIKDSTRFNLLDRYAHRYPGYGGHRPNSGAAISIQYEYDYLSGQVTDLSLTPATRNDQRDSREGGDQVMAGDLLIRDLGYATLGHMVKVASKGAFFLNRLDTQLKVHTRQGAEVDLVGICRKMGKKGLPYMELDVLVGKGRDLPCRLVVSRVDQRTYEKRIASASKRAKSQGYNLSERYKALARLNVLVTNAVAGQLPAPKVMELYGLRWHIELVFKSWKSICRINRFARAKVERFECLLLAKLIWAMACWNGFLIARQWIERNDATVACSCSLQKFYKKASRLSLLLRSAIWGRPEKARQWARALLEGPVLLVATEKRKGRKSLRQKADSLYIAQN